MGFKGKCVGVSTRVRGGVSFVHEWRNFDGKPTDAMLADKYLKIEKPKPAAPPAADKPKTAKRKSTRSF